MSNAAIRRLAIAILLTIAATWGVDAILAQPTLTGIDDANIYFVYARNIAAGHGYVFTPGYERVEGGTSILWTLICAACFFVTSKPYVLLLVISMGFCAGALYAALSLSRALIDSHPVSKSERRLAQLLCIIWFASIPGFYLWNTITLMDAALWALAVQLLVLFPVRDNFEDFRRSANSTGLAFAAGLASLTRPEAIALVPGVVFVAVACAAAKLGWRGALLRHRAAMLSFAGVQALMLTFRLAYFGDPVPNTYFAKVSRDSVEAFWDGLDYLGSYLVEQPLVIVLVIAVLACFAVEASRLLVGRRAGESLRANRIAFIGSAVILGGLSMPLLTGGDHFGSHRFFQPYALLLIYPFLHLLLGLLAGRGATRPVWQRAALVWVAILVVAGFGASSWTQFGAQNHLGHEFIIARHGVATGEAIALAFPDSRLPSIGVVAAGGLALGHQGRTLDLLGLNWREMAHAPVERQGMRGHSAFNSRVFWTQPPEFMTPTLLRREPASVDDILVPFKAAVLNQIFSKPRFRRAYVPGAIETERGWVAGFFLRSWLQAGPENAGIERIPWRPKSSSPR